jgi:competence protein ComEA
MEKWVERYRSVLFLALVVLLITVVILIQRCQPEPEAIMLSTATPQPTPEATSTPQPLRVYVSGAVQQPDVYILSPGSIVKDAIMAASGSTDNADLDRINLAATLADGQQVYVPYQGEDNPPVEPPSGAAAAGDKININTADAMALESLPGIGPSLAQRIIDYRLANGPYGQIEEITNVSGIGPGVFAKIEALITVR